MPNFVNFGTTGDPYLDGLLSGAKWTDAVITFSLPTAAIQYGDPALYADTFGDDVGSPTTGFVALAADHAAAVRAAAAEVNALVANLTLLEDVASPGDAVIRVANTTVYTASGGWSYGIGSQDWRGDIWANAGWMNGLLPETRGDLGWEVLYHELGHSLGLSHPHDDGGIGGASVPTDRDSQEFTVMAYKAYVSEAHVSTLSQKPHHYPQSYMMYDIAALQYMYGADFTTNAGNTLYSFSPHTGEMYVNRTGQGAPVENILFRTIWDGGGTDTYDFSSYATDLSVNLAPGGWVDVDRAGNFQAADLNRHFYADPPSGPQVFARGQVFNALLYQGDTRSLIENGWGGSGDDVMRGNTARNALLGGEGDDSLYGLEGNDTLLQATGGGVLDGGTGNDLLFAGDGVDLLFGGTGSDTASYALSDAGVEVDLQTGTGSLGWAEGDLLFGIEHLEGSEHADRLRGDSLANVLTGGDGADVLEGFGGADNLRGGKGGDVLIGGAGGDVLNGGVGIDTARYAGRAVVLNLTTGVHGGDAAGDTFLSIERYEGSDHRDDLAADLMTGNGTSQTLDGRRGNDTLRGEGGSDFLFGGRDNDLLEGGEGNDVLNGGPGTDTLDGGDGTADYASFLGLGVGVVVEMGVGLAVAAPEAAAVLIGIENVIGTDHADTITGNGGDNLLLGGDGGDELAGGPGGADTLNGEGGDDTVLGSAGDSLVGGFGFDELHFADAGGAVTINLGNGVHGGGALGASISGFERILGTAAGDDMRGAGQAITLVGGGGNDTLRGGGAGDSLLGGADADRLQGRDGDDSLTGGTGNDTLDGGNGWDFFLYAFGDGIDRIENFATGQDRVLLHQGSFGIFAEAPTSDYVHVGAVAPDESHGWFLLDGSLLRWDADGAGGAAAVTLMLFAGGVTPAVADLGWQ